MPPPTEETEMRLRGKGPSPASPLSRPEAELSPASGDKLCSI